ncbi:MAG: hypothetical protein NT149_00895 [Candidatus Gottesmanbacteria bacterium]|nr:hypothetical protein [Candidatus Gottesmanbacteria bacterium]
MKTKVVKRYVIGGLLLIITNLVVLDYFFIKNYINEQYVLGEATTAATAAKCPAGCLTAINKLAGTTTATAKEYFVPLGTGTNTTSDWADVTGASATVDSAQYPRIKKVIFEATVAVPTGNQVAYVRLFNKTDGHPVWFSEMSMNTTGPTLLTSQSVTLDKGSKLYQVQMKTQLQSPATLNQSRIHITTY